MLNIGFVYSRISSIIEILKVLAGKGDGTFFANALHEIENGSQAGQKKVQFVNAGSGVELEFALVKALILNLNKITG